MKKTVRTMTLAVLMLLLANGAAMAAAPGPESDPNNVYWDDAFVPPGMNNGNAPSNSIYGMASDGFGNMYVGGDFTAVGGMAANYVAKWNGSTWSTLGTGLDGGALALACDGAGALYAGGEFTTAGGVTANRVAKWDGTTWSALGTGMNHVVTALAVDGSGNLYAGGYFTTAGGVTVNRVAKWDGTAWSALGTGMNNYVNALTTDVSGNLYAGGFFTTAGGVTVNRVAKWDGTAWAALGTGMNNFVMALATDASGNLYAGGNFTTAGGLTANRIAKWGGTNWSALGSGINYAVYALAVDGTGNVYAGGLTDHSIVQWNGTSWSGLGSCLGDSGLLVWKITTYRNVLFAGGTFTTAGSKPSFYFAEWQPRVNQSETPVSASPGLVTLGNDIYGFYKPALKTDGDTTVSYADGLPVNMTLGRAKEIQLGGIRVNGACTLSPAGVSFGGSGATLTVEFSEDDAAAFGVPYTEFRAMRLTYPADYGANKEAEARALLGTTVPTPVRVENGKQIYAITVPFAGTTSNVAYAPAPATFALPEAAPGPESGPNDVYWDDAFCYPGLNGTVYAAVRNGAGNLYVGGAFTFASDVVANYIAKWDGTSWSALGSGMSGNVWALALDSSGNLYAGGEFTSAGGVTANRVAKWDGTAWSALGSGMDNTVRALALDSSGNLYAGGLFTTAGGALARTIAKWDGIAWSDMGTGLTNPIYALAVDASDALYAGGYQTFSRRGASETAWTSLTSNIGGSVTALAVDASGNVYAGGDFIGMNGAINYLAKWNGSAISGLNAETNGAIRALVFDGSGNLYAGGGFVMAGAVTVNNVAFWNGTAWSAMGAGVNNTVRALALDGSGNLYAGGQFTTAGGVAANGAAHWNGTAWEGLVGPGNAMSSNVYATAADGAGNLYAGGTFKTAGGVIANCVAKWNGSTWSALGTGMNNTVRALALDGSGNLYAGGNFTTAGGVAVNYVAKWDGTTWSALGTGMSDTVRALALDGARNLYAGGQFATAGGVTVNKVAKWDGTAWSALGTGIQGVTTGIPGVTTGVYALAVDNVGNLYAGGDITTAGDMPANRVAKWDGTAWSALGTGMNNTVYALAFDGSGNLYAGGFFTTAGGVTANYVAKWDGTAWSALGTGMDNWVLALACDNAGNLYAGGMFPAAGGVTANRLAQWNGTAWNALGSGCGGRVYTLSIDRNTLFFGGIFVTAGDKASYYFAQWQPRVNRSRVALAASPGTLTLGDDAAGFYKPALMTDASTTVAYSGGLPVTVSLNRAMEIQVNGIRVNGAFTLGPEAVQFGGSGATLRVEFSEDDTAAFGAPYTDFRAVKLTYPASYPTSKNAATVTQLSVNTAVPIRIENGKQIFAITIPFTEIGSTYAAVPLTLYTPPTAPSNPGATAIGLDTITWTWTDNSSNETGFNVYDDPGAGPPNTLQFTTGMGVQLWQHNGLGPNTQYAFQVSAVNAYAESARSDTLTAWTLIEQVTDLWFSNSTATELAVMATNTPSNLSGGASGLLFANTTAGTDSGWQQNNDGWTSSSLTPNTLYTFTGQSRNGASIASMASTGSRRTLAAAPSVGNNIVCDKTTNTQYPVDAVFTFSNPADFGEGTHGGNAYRTSRFRYAWDTSDTHFFSDGDPAWNDGTLELNPTGSGSYYVHLQSINADGMPGTTLDYGPFVVDGDPPTATFTLLDPTPTALDVVRFGVSFSEPVMALDVSNVTITGTLSGTPQITGTNPNFVVSVVLTEPNADGAVGISIDTTVQDLVGNPYEGGESPLYTVIYWPGFTTEPQDARKYVGDTHTFSAALASGMATYQWKWSDAVSQTVHDGPTTPTWTLTGLTTDNRGEYWCEVTYNGVVFPTRHAELFVENHLQVSMPATAQEPAGGSHTFTVQTTGGYGPLSYFWKKDEVTIQEAEDASYTRSGLTVGDSGTYTVEVLDSNSDVHTASTALTVTQGVPVASLAGLSALLGLLMVGGIRKMRKK